jgi:hypothetical protein
MVAELSSILNGLDTHFSLVNAVANLFATSSFGAATEWTARTAKMFKSGNWLIFCSARWFSKKCQ